MSDQVKTTAAVVALALLSFVCGYLLPAKQQPLTGGTVSNVEESFDEGILVDGKKLISGVGRIEQAGATTEIVTSSASYPLTPANVCDNSAIRLTPMGATATFTLPPTSTIFNTCMDKDGDFIDLAVANGSSVTSSVLAQSGSNTLLFSSSTTILPGKAGLLRLIRSSSAQYMAMFVNLDK